MEKNVGNYTKLFLIFVLPGLGAWSLGFAATLVSGFPVGVLVGIGLQLLFTGIQIGLFQKKL